MGNVEQWLLDGDVAIQYMTHKMLLHSDQSVLSELRQRIESEGFGSRFLSYYNDSGHWDVYYYQRKWTSTHYTLLDLKNLNLPPTNILCRNTIKRMFDDCMLENGGMNLSKYDHPSDICVDGMVLNYAAYFCPEEPRMIKLAEHIIANQKPDGGFSWDNVSDKSDPHTTICVLEGLSQFTKPIPNYKLTEIGSVQADAVEFLFANKLFIDDKDSRFRRLSYPYRYRYDLLRVLEYLAESDMLEDVRTKPALEWLQNKRKPDGMWYLENTHKGNIHFEMETVGQPSRFITQKALAILESLDN